jgi:hypothetical protein
VQPQRLAVRDDPSRLVDPGELRQHPCPCRRAPTGAVPREDVTDLLLVHRVKLHHRQSQQLQPVDLLLQGSVPCLYGLFVVPRCAWWRSQTRRPSGSRRALRGGMIPWWCGRLTERSEGVRGLWPAARLCPSRAIEMRAPMSRPHRFFTQSLGRSVQVWVCNRDGPNIPTYDSHPCGPEAERARPRPQRCAGM